MKALGDLTVRLALHECSGCHERLSAYDDEMIALVRDDLGTEIDYYHVSHAPIAVMMEHYTQEAAR